MIVCDFHVHLGKSRDGTSLDSAELLRIMRSAGVKSAVIFPIDEPDVGLSYEPQNKKILKEAKRHPELIPFCRLNPRHRKAALAELKNCYHAGFRGLKLHPRSEKISPDSLNDIFGLVSDMGWPVVLHTSHEKNCHPMSWEKSFKQFKKIRFIFAHGGKDSYQEAIEVAARNPNTFLDTSTLSYNRTKTILKQLGPERILFASDQPYSHIALEMKKFELICNRRELAIIFKENAKTFFPDIFNA